MTKKKRFSGMFLLSYSYRFCVWAALGSPSSEIVHFHSFFLHICSFVTLGDTYLLIIYYSVLAYFFQDTFVKLKYEVYNWSSCIFEHSKSPFSGQNKWFYYVIFL